MTTSSILRKLKGGDRRSIGRSNEVVAEVLPRPELFGALFSGLSVDDPVVRLGLPMPSKRFQRSTLKGCAPTEPHSLTSSRCDQKEVRWHIAQRLPRLRWNAREQHRVYNILAEYLGDSSSIVKTFAMQALADLTTLAAERCPTALRQLKKLTAHGTPAMRAR